MERYHQTAAQFVENQAAAVAQRLHGNSSESGASPGETDLELLHRMQQLHLQQTLPAIGKENVPEKTVVPVDEKQKKAVGGEKKGGAKEGAKGEKASKEGDIHSEETGEKAASGYGSKEQGGDGSVAGGEKKADQGYGTEATQMRAALMHFIAEENSTVAASSLLAALPPTLLFLAEMFPELPNYRPDLTCPVEMMKFLGDMWGKMTTEEKQPYVDESKRLADKYGALEDAGHKCPHKRAQRPKKDRRRRASTSCL